MAESLKSRSFSFCPAREAKSLNSDVLSFPNLSCWRKSRIMARNELGNGYPGLGDNSNGAGGDILSRRASSHCRDTSSSIAYSLENCFVSRSLGTKEYRLVPCFCWSQRACQGLIPEKVPMFLLSRGSVPTVLKLSLLQKLGKGNHTHTPNLIRPRGL